MRITALSGGVGGARFLRGLLTHLDARATRHPDAEPATLTVVGNTGDDIWLHGLRVCPDIDSVLYTLGGGSNDEQGWGRADETYVVQSELAAYGSEPQWFGLGDRDLATHVHRTNLLARGRTLTEVTANLATRWGLPQRGVTLLPMTDAPVETHVVVDDPAAEGGRTAIHFQEWWVRHGAALPAHSFAVPGLADAPAAPGVLNAIRGADVVVLPPSNPVVSIGIVLGVPGVREALRGTTAPVVGLSPIVGGAPVRGHADACLAAIGVETSAAAVAGLYADFLDGWLVDTGDVAALETLARTQPRLATRAVPLLMTDVDATAAMAGAALDLAQTPRG